MNSGADWLGAFYEVFLKYANWAQDLGIVLTPRTATRLKHVLKLNTGFGGANGTLILSHD